HQRDLVAGEGSRYRRRGVLRTRPVPAQAMGQQYGHRQDHLQRRCLVRTPAHPADRKSTRLNSSHQIISYAVFCLKKKKIRYTTSKKTKRQETDKHAKEFERNTNTVNQGYKAHRYSQSRGD